VKEMGFQFYKKKERLKDITAPTITLSCFIFAPRDDRWLIFNDYNFLRSIIEIYLNNSNSAYSQLL